MIASCLFLSVAFACMLLHTGREAWVDAKAQQHECRCHPLLPQKPLTPELRMAIEQLRDRA